MPKTNAQYCREYRQKKKREQNKMKKVPKSTAQRVREFRARRKATSTVQYSSNSEDSCSKDDDTTNYNEATEPIMEFKSHDDALQGPFNYEVANTNTKVEVKCETDFETLNNPVYEQLGLNFNTEMDGTNLCSQIDIKEEPIGNSYFQKQFGYDCALGPVSDPYIKIEKPYSNAEIKNEPCSYTELTTKLELPGDIPTTAREVNLDPNIKIKEEPIDSSYFKEQHGMNCALMSVSDPKIKIEKAYLKAEVKEEVCDYSDFFTKHELSSSSRDTKTRKANIKCTVKTKEELDCTRFKKKSISDTVTGSSFNTDVKAMLDPSIRVKKELNCESDYNAGVRIASCSIGTNIIKTPSALIFARGALSKQKTFRCNKCLYHGPYKRYLAHVATKCSGTLLFCSHCNHVFQSFKTYLYHLVEHKLNYNTCPECGQHFEGLAWLSFHIKKHIMDLFQLHSSECNTTINPELQSFVCTQCKDLVKAEQFFSHWDSHLSLDRAEEIDLEENSNEECDSSKIMSPKLAKTVLDIVLTKEEKILTCVVCKNKSYYKCAEGKRHLIEHLLNDARANTSSTNNRLRCPVCGHDLTSVAEWKQHFREHAKLPTYPCQLCPEVFYDSSSFSKHNRKHNGSHTCDVCGEKYISRANLAKHVKSHKRPKESEYSPCTTVPIQVTYEGNVRTVLVPADIQPKVQPVIGEDASRVTEVSKDNQG